MRAHRSIGFIGAGNIAEALLRGLLTSGVAAPDRCLIANRSSDERLARVARSGVRTTRDRARVMKESDIIVLAVKPQDMPQALAEIAPHTRDGQLVISVAAGVTTELIEGHLGRTPVVRAMPNTGCAVGASATALCRGRWANEQHLAAARLIFQAVGQVVVVPEPLFDLVTGLSGTGPAYVYLLAEAMVEAGVRAGLSSGAARALVTQTVLGAGKMLVESGEEPATLRQHVTSPNGTTMAAMRVLDEAGFYAAVIRAVERATQRAGELRRVPGAPSTATPPSTEPRARSVRRNQTAAERDPE
jgi:pyrroline-5-carboxylate reductase